MISEGSQREAGGGSDPHKRRRQGHSGGAMGRMDAREEMELIRRAQSGDVAARQQVIDSHHGLVLHLAATFRCSAFERDDIIQEGFLGMLRALDGFDTGRGCRFSTYATYWIRQSIQRAIDRTGRMIGIPVDLAHSVQRVEAARDAYIREHGFPPTLPELAAEASVSLRRLAGLMTSLAEPLSLDAPRESEDEAPREMADPAARDPEEEALRVVEREQLRGWLNLLPEPDRIVLEGRFGLHGYELSEEEFRNRYGLDPASVRRIERRALRRLRAQVHRRGTTSPSSHSFTAP
jgi:RNA polymerase sigma factor (sigma-70 family)